MHNDSAGQQPRLVIELKRDANANVVLNNLYKHTPLQTSFGVNMLALVDGVPRTLNLAQAISHYVAHQVEVIRRRSEFRLRKARNRAHIVEGLLKAIDMLDAVIATIRASDDRPAARTALMAEPFSFTEEQANHILDMTLGRLTRLGRTELEEEMTQLRETIAELEAILADEAKLRGVIETELTEIRDKYANERRSVITHDPGELGVEDLIDDEEIVVTLTRAGYIKSVAAAAFRTQGRGGRGRPGRPAEGRGPRQPGRPHDDAHVPAAVLQPGPGLPAARPRDPDEGAHGAGHGRGQPAPAGAERVDHGHRRHPRLPARPVPGLRHGPRQVKKTAFSEYDKSRREGFIAINLRDGDELVRVVATTGNDDLFEVTRNGMTIRFNEEDVRAMGRDAAGVRGIRLRAGDLVVSCDVAADDTDILIVTDAGYGKRTKLERFNRQARGGQGVRGIRLTGARGFVVGAFMVALDDEILLVSSGGVVIRTAAREIASQGRDATGVRVMNLDDGQTVAAVARVAAEADEE